MFFTLSLNSTLKASESVFINSFNGFNLKAESYFKESLIIGCEIPLNGKFSIGTLSPV